MVHYTRESKNTGYGKVRQGKARKLTDLDNNKKQQENSQTWITTKMNQQGQRESQDLNTHEGNGEQVGTIRTGQVISGRQEEVKNKL